MKNLQNIPRIQIDSAKAKAIKSRKHPWIYDGAIPTEQPDIENGELVKIVSKNAGTIGYGLFCKYSRIRVRIVSFGDEELQGSWLQGRVEAAFKMRAGLSLGSNGYRLVNGEGDFLPGLVVDVYNTTTVVRPLVRFMEINIQSVISACNALLPGNSVYLKRDEHAVRNEHLALTNGYLHGKGDGSETIDENGLRLKVDIANGQKTGFYLDQRENRRITMGLSRGRSVCNLFSYTGGFSVAAMAGGAKKVLSVDSSESAISLARENMALNKIDAPCETEYVSADVFDMIEKSGKYDIVVLDPPPFARRKSELKGALSGYGYLNESALRICSPHGFLLTFSCSGAVTREMFMDTVRRAALAAGRHVSVARELHADSDHPVSITHPEGEYLKGFLLYVE